MTSRFGLKSGGCNQCLGCTNSGICVWRERLTALPDGFRKQVDQECQLRNNRVRMLSLSQGILFAAVCAVGEMPALAGQKALFVSLVLGAMGIINAVSYGAILKVNTDAGGILRGQWEAIVAEYEAEYQIIYDGPGIEGVGERGWLGYIYPSITLPVTFVVAWLAAVVVLFA